MYSSGNPPYLRYNLPCPVFPAAGPTLSSMFRCPWDRVDSIIARHGKYSILVECGLMSKHELSFLRHTFWLYIVRELA